MTLIFWSAYFIVCPGKHTPVLHTQELCLSSTGAIFLTTHANNVWGILVAFSRAWHIEAPQERFLNADLDLPHTIASKLCVTAGWRHILSMGSPNKSMISKWWVSQDRWKFQLWNRLQAPSCRWTCSLGDHQLWAWPRSCFQIDNYWGRSSKAISSKSRQVLWETVPL